MDLSALIRVRRKPNVEMRPIDSGAVLVDMVSGTCFELNHTGLEVWNLLVDEVTPTSIAAALALRYGISAEVASVDVARVIAALSEQHLVTLSSADGHRE